MNKCAFSMSSECDCDEHRTIAYWNRTHILRDCDICLSSSLESFQRLLITSILPYFMAFMICALRTRMFTTADFSTFVCSSRVPFCWFSSYSHRTTINWRRICSKGFEGRKYVNSRSHRVKFLRGDMNSISWKRHRRWWGWCEWL